MEEEEEVGERGRPRGLLTERCQNKEKPEISKARETPRGAGGGVGWGGSSN